MTRFCSNNEKFYQYAIANRSHYQDLLTAVQVED
jgi:hypothetical protein